MDKIKALLDKEHKLYSKDGLSLEERKEVEKLQVELDRYHIPIIPFTVPCELSVLAAPQKPNTNATIPAIIILEGV